MQGILIVDKPMEWTSFDVIAKRRHRQAGPQRYAGPHGHRRLPVFLRRGPARLWTFSSTTPRLHFAPGRGWGCRPTPATSPAPCWTPATAGEKELLGCSARCRRRPCTRQRPALYKLRAREGVTVERKARPIEILDIRYGGSPVENEYVLTVRCRQAPC